MTKQLHNEIFDKKKLIAVIRKQIFNVQENDIEWYNDGWDYVVAAANSQAFRFPRRKEYENRLPREVSFMKQFTSYSPITIPKLELHKDQEIGSYTSYQFIKGVQFKKDIAKKFSTDNLLQIAKQLGSFLTALHSFPVQKAHELGFEEVDTFQSWTQRFESIQKLVYPHLNQNEQNWTTQLFTKYLHLIKNNPVENKVIHSDIMPEHIIVNPESQQLAGIIDFADTEISDPAYDFTYLRKYGDIFLEEAYKSYQLHRDSHFEERRQFYEDRLLVANLEHSIIVGNSFWIEKHLQELKEHLKQIS